MKSPNLDDLEPLVIKWAEKKGIFKNGTPYKQLLKTAYNVIKNRTGKIINGVFIRDEK